MNHPQEERVHLHAALIQMDLVLEETETVAIPLDAKHVELLDV